MAGRDNLDYANFTHLLDEAKENNLIDEKIYDLMTNLKNIRNKYVHLPLADSSETLERRQFEEKKQ